MATTVESPPVTADHQPSDGASRWSRLSSLGFSLAAAGPVIMLAAALVWGLDVGSEIGFFVVSIGLAVAAAILVRRARTWVKVVGLVLGLLVVGALFWTAFGLLEPASFFDFVTGVLVVPGVLVGLGAGIAAVRAHRRGDLTAAAAGRERGAMQAVLAAVAVLVVVSGVVTMTGRETVGSDVEVDLTVKMSDFEFDQEGYTAEPGARILVRNTDPFLHTFTVDELDIDVRLGPGSEKVVVVPDQPGSYVLYCEPHTGDREDPSDDDMASRLEVR